MKPSPSDSVLKTFVVRIESESGEILGTGVVVQPRRVLTAAHVVEKVVDRPLRVRSWRKNAQPRVARCLRPCYDEKLDIALLELLENPDDQPSQALEISLLPPKRKSAWESRGYPKVREGAQDEYRDYFDASGSCESFTHGAQWMELNADAQPPDCRGWMGYSGAPVFLGDCLHGVIFEVLDGVSSRLFAVPCVRFLENPALRDALALGNAEQGRELARVRVRERLCAMLEANRDLEGLLRSSLLKPLPAGSPELATGLLALSPGDYGKVFHRAVKQRRGAEDDDLRETLVRLFALGLPWLKRWPSHVSRAFDQIGAERGVEVLSVATEGFVEILRAGVENRPCLFEIRKPRGLVGRASIEIEPGSCLEPERFVQGIIEQSAKMLDCEARRPTVRGYLRSRQELEDEDAPRVYLVARRGGSIPRACLDRLRDATAGLPEIEIIELDGLDEDAEAEEQIMLATIKTLLQVVGGASRD